MANADLPPFEIFRAGRHRSADGRVIEFTQAQLAATAAGYDPALYEAPIVIGHPKTNAPAYGWVGRLSLTDDGRLIAHPRQANADFVAMVKDGAFKKRSASFFLPETPGNPKPGQHYIRHAGFLGAAPPAVVGLADISFEGAEDGFVEFSADFSETSWFMRQVAEAFRGLRNWIIDKDGLEAADRVLAEWPISDMQQTAANLVAEEAAPAPEYSGQPDETPAPPPPAPPEVPAAQTPPPAAPDAREAEFAARSADLDSREAELRKQEIASFVGGLVADVRIPATRQADWVECLTDLYDSPLPANFDAAKKPPVERIKELLAAQPPLVELGEVGHKADGAVDFSDSLAVRDAILEVIHTEAQVGRTITPQEALIRIRGKQ